MHLPNITFVITIPISILALVSSYALRSRRLKLATAMWAIGWGVVWLVLANGIVQLLRSAPGSCDVQSEKFLLFELTIYLVFVTGWAVIRRPNRRRNRR